MKPYIKPDPRWQHYLALRLTWLLFTAMTVPAVAQTQDSLWTSYRRGLQTDHWTAGIHKRWTPARNTTLAFSEVLISDRLATSTEGDKWRDQINGSLNLEYWMHPRLKLLAECRQFRYNDRLSGLERDIQTHSAAVGVDWRSKIGRLPFKVGIVEDRRSRQIDSGPRVETGLEIPDLRLGQYRNTLYSRANADWLNRRQNHTLDVTYLAHRQFEGGTEDSLWVQVLNQRRDYYFDTAGLIESRHSEGYLLENRLHYDLGTNQQFSLRSGLQWKQLSIHHADEDQRQLQRRRDDFKSELHMSISTRGDSYHAVASMGFTTRQEQYELGVTQSLFGRSLATPDNQGRRNYAALHLGWRLRYSDSLHVVARIQKLQYDTPDEANVDDRDELRWRVEAQWIHAFSPWLESTLKLSANGDHIVYLSGQRSADNQWMRNLRLEPSLRWTPSPRWTWHQTARIMANYVDYDFESLLPNVRSYTYRRLAISDTVQYRVSGDIRLTVQYQMERDETGKLDWNRWQEQRMISRIAHDLNLGFAWHPSPYWRIAPGYHYYRRRGRQHGFDSKISSDFIHWGPTLHIQYRERGLLWTLRVQMNRTKVLSRHIQRAARVQLKCRWAI